MKEVDYFSIIRKYIKPTSPLFRIYLIHCILVTSKAIKIAKRLNLKKSQIRFIEEAGMLHDIGIVKTNIPEICCFGNKEYIQHGIEGSKILKKEGLLKHAKLVEKHVGYGISKKQIIKRQLPLPKKDLIPKTIEEKIISYSDLFFTKKPNLIWHEETWREIKKFFNRFKDEGYEERFNEWRKMFEK